MLSSIVWLTGVENHLTAFGQVHFSGLGVLLRFTTYS